MEELEIKLGKEKAPSGLSAVEFLGGSEVRQVLVIRKDHSGKRGTVEIVAPGLQSLVSCCQASGELGLLETLLSSLRRISDSRRTSSRSDSLDRKSVV